ncbi:family 4 glycosyl hydrolase [Aestuariimicrobium ganziense]|uniref:family 4 glycosyl hydrolase n=1 Tax=Aestuariimicrobium ganziense TaxID=2773677 RepID=UPI001945B72B|nr:glycoside hydrolase [Aestuariimicrobium ganziense]
MARIKLAYIGGGSSRAAGTMHSFIDHGEEFDGSEVVLIDHRPEHLELVRTIAQKLADHAGLDLTITTTTDQRAGLTDVDAVLSSFRPGNFEMRQADEQIPMRHGVIGQETQGPGGFMMALRSLHAFQSILADLEAVAPKARIFNYTNPVNLVSQAISQYTDWPIWSMCEGPITFWPPILETAGLDPAKAKVMMAGVNHNCWSTEHTYDGQDLMPLLAEADERLKDDPTVPVWQKRMLHLAVAMDSIPSDYFRYYYFGEEWFREAQAQRRTRAGVLLDALPGYWQHYEDQAKVEVPALDPDKSRGGIHELELAIDVMSAFYNDEPAELPVNLPNVGGELPGFDDDTVVEVWCTVDGSGCTPLPQRELPHQVRGITQTLAEYQRLAASAAWEGTRHDAVQALAAHPFVRNLNVAEELYDDLAWANREFLPERLLK